MSSRHSSLTDSPAWKVLVVPGGTEIGLEIQKSLSPCRNVTLYSAGIDVPNHAPYVFKRHFTIPRFDAPDFVPRLRTLINDLEIDFVYPAHDSLIVALAENVGQIGACVVGSPLETCRIARSKAQTYRHLAGVVPVPRVFASPHDIDQFPVFAKPDCGQGSERTHLVTGVKLLEHLLGDADDYLFLEYLPGEEFTVDCFTHRKQGILFCEPRERLRTKSGIAMSSRIRHDLQELCRSYAERIGRRMTFHGTWFFQLKKGVDGELKLLEVAPRIAGTMALSRVRGANLALLNLFEQAGISVEIMLNDAGVQIDRALVNRYRHNISFNSVYVDLDDTLIHRGLVNLAVVRFLYQCINQRKRIVLLTRHRGDLTQTLARHRLSGLFDEVIQVDEGQRKSDAIREPDAIMVDDSFRERKDAFERLGIPTFDGSMLELLVDDME